MKKNHNTNIDKNMEELELSLLVWKQNRFSTSENTSVSYKIKYMLTMHDPAVPSLGIYSNEMKTYTHTKTYIQIS